MLSVHFSLANFEGAAPVAVTERRGEVHYLLSKGLFVPEGVAALNVAVQEVLAGGQWFQLWKGEIVSMGSPTIGGQRGRVHRGPLVH